MNIAFIPVRGNSKSIPEKNIKIINGKPLVYWVSKAACECKYISKVYISTDSEKIFNTVEEIKKGEKGDLLKKIKVIRRSPESASDTASTESAMIEFAENYDFDHIALIQATSPLLKSEDLDRGFETLTKNSVDCVLSVVKQKRFLWNIDQNGDAYPTNYNYNQRPRRQDFDGYFVENGAFYICSKESLLKTKCRLSGKIRLIEMKSESYIEIDEPSDWELVEILLKQQEKPRS